MDSKAARGVASLCNHVGIVVKDLEKTIEFYSSTLGVAPFQIREFKTEGATFHGKPTSAKFKTAVAPIGQCEMEVIQVLEGETPHTEFLRSKGEGLNHLCFEVGDMDDFVSNVAQLAKRGIEPFFGYPEAGFAYLDSEKIGGVTFELLRRRRGMNHVGVVVEDLEKTIEFYSSTLGVGPFQIREFKTEGIMFYGRPTSARFKAAFTAIGQCEMELIQVLEGETPHTEFLRSKGEGLNHLCLEVRDFENKMAELGKKGIRPLYYYGGSEGAFVYLNTDKIGGVTFELIER